ncbi:MAG: substrate binding domain-containing protein [Pseudobdellovibrionaceae bacterium]
MSSLQEAAELFETQTNPFEMHGSVKITAPNTLGVRFLSTPLSIFTKKFPNVNVEILLVDSYLDFVEDEIDVALRILKPTDSSLIAKKIADNPISFYASPGYLKDNKGIHKVEDLVHHKVFCIPQHWVLQFERSKRKIKEIIQKTSIQCSNGDLLVEMACQGVGVVLRSDWGVRREVEDGKLVKLELDDRLVSDTGVYLVYPKQKNSPPRVKALIDIMRVSIPLNLQKS